MSFSFCEASDPLKPSHTKDQKFSELSKTLKRSGVYPKFGDLPYAPSTRLSPYNRVTLIGGIIAFFAACFGEVVIFAR